ncbi:MAG: glutamate--tRNA ligase [Clostridia bacterium]|nr:glutamate--tRNA ligase [Clostridia bacterium]
MREKPVVSRFAPSPTGYMHIGNLRTALYSYLIARHGGGKFILRIEDTDRERFVEGATDVIIRTLATTGITYDEGPGVGGEHGPYVQSERKPIYMEYAKKLVDLGAAYYCFCTKERLEQLHEEDATGGYDRHCRDLSPEEVEKNLAEGKPFVIRQKMPLTGTTSYTDSVFGEISVENEELQDQILMKADGYPTYNFCHVVDDYLMGVTHVVRGSEYLTSTPKYVLLYDAYGWERPTYVHLPLLMGKGADGTISKLSKRHGAVSFEDLVADGYLPEAIVNYIALLGWAPKGEMAETEFFTLPELEAAFDIAGVNKSPSVFDFDKLLWFNGEYIKKLDFEHFRRLALPFLKTPLPAGVDTDAALRLLQGRIGKLGEVEEKCAFFRALPEYEPDLFENKKNKVTLDLAKQVLEAALPVLSAVSAWNNDTLYTALLSVAELLACKSGAVMWAVRISVSGMSVTPGGATEIMTVVGREESLARIRIALEKL